MVEMMNMKINLLENLTVATVIIFTVGVNSAWIISANAIEKNEFDETLVRIINKEILEKFQKNNLAESKLVTCEYRNGKIINEKCKTILKINSNEYYFGEFSNEKFDGVGVYQVYEKILTSEIIHIEGVIKWQYSGNWKNGKKHGYGLYKDNVISKQGYWDNDKFLGEGKINRPNVNLGQIGGNETSPSFDCRKAKSRAEKLICADSQLSSLDRELNNYYIQAKKISFDKENFKKETESAWIKREKECFDKNCLVNWYVSRKLHYQKVMWAANVIIDDRNKILSNDTTNIEKERQQLIEERRKFEEEKLTREQARNTQRINLQISNTQPNSDGDFVINIKTSSDTASLKINDEEFGGRADGNYIIKKVARAGQETKFTIIAKDTNGNTDSKTITVTRQVIASNQIKYAELNPTLVKTQLNKDAVAIIIGIADYKNLPRADFANDDARAFYDYAIRGLGVKAENIKLLVDADAGQGEILKTFKTWLPARVKSTTDIYVYYSGHGLPSADGQTLYLLPQLADRDLIEDTAVSQSRINAAIQAAKPKSVTIFLDSCYSGAARTGQTLLASTRPISLKANTQTFPSEFTVFSASTAEQISSSSNELKHGIFSYYLMRGMEGNADTNKDGKITAGEMQTYLTENVAKQASLANRLQQPQLTGDANRVLVGR